MLIEIFEGFWCDPSEVLSVKAVMEGVEVDYRETEDMVRHHFIPAKAGNESHIALGVVNVINDALCEPSSPSGVEVLKGECDLYCLNCGVELTNKLMISVYAGYMCHACYFPPPVDKEPVRVTHVNDSDTIVECYGCAKAMNPQHMWKRDMKDGLRFYCKACYDAERERHHLSTSARAFVDETIAEKSGDGDASLKK